MLGLSRRGALVIAFLAFEVLVALISEGTSLGNHFTRSTVGVVWAVVLLTLSTWSYRELAGRFELRGRAARAVAFARSTSIEERVWAGAGLVWLGVLAAIAWLYPPSNGDSLVYHLARVAHWVQDGSVRHYASHYLAQIELGPLHEYNLAHLHLLAGSDRLDGYVQLLAVVVAIAGASEVARLLGGSRRAQVVTAVLVATVPSVILEATSTQNNDFGGAIAIALVILVLVWKPSGRCLPGAALIGLAAGAAVLSKGTLIAFLAPVGLFLVAASTLAEGRTDPLAPVAFRLAAGGVVAGIAALVVTGPFLARNVDLFGSPSGPVTQSTISRELTAQAAAANVVRSSAGNFAIGDGADGLRTRVGRVVLRSSERVFEQFGVAQEDQRYALGSDLHAFSRRGYSDRERLEEFGANPWHVVLLVVAGGALSIEVIRGHRADRRRWLLAFGLAVGYLLFTATARWSVFAVRYQIPLLVAWCPLIALVLVRLRPWLSVAVLLVLSSACIPQLLDNSSRSVLHPQWDFSSDLEPYFISASLREVSPDVGYYEGLTRAIAEGSCDRLGIANWILVEYPIWVGLADGGWAGRISDVGVQNESKVLEVADFDPCALVRQVDDRYVTTVDGLANLRFGPLALSMRPALMADVGADAPGFASEVPGVRVRPGGGWRLAGERPALAGQGSLFVTSREAGSVRLRLGGPSGAVAVERGGPGDALLPLPTVAGPGDLTVDLTVPAGTSELVVSAAPTPDGPSAPVLFEGIRLLPGVGS